MEEATTELDEELSSEEPTSTPPLSATPSAQLINCGYYCTKYVYSQPITKSSYDSLTKEQRETIKEEYYKSYDFMTGIRTAEFLGGSILLFCLFVLYKMKCRPSRGRKMSVVDSSKLASTETSNILRPVELTSSPDIVLSEAANDRDSGCQNGSASNSNVSFSRRGSTRIETPVSPMELTRFSAGRLSCGNIPFPSSVLWSESLLRPSSVQCMSLGLQQQPFHCRPVHIRKTSTDQSNELIDIHIIQPTPNASPIGSKRRLSYDSGHLKPSSTLSIPKSHSCLQSALSGRTNRGAKSIKPRRLSLSPGDCYLTSSNRAQNVELMGSHLVIPNSPTMSTSSIGRLNPMTFSTAPSTPLGSLDLLQSPSKLAIRRLSGRSTADEHVIEIHKSPESRRPSTSCHVSWLPVTSRQNTGLPLDVNCVLIENEDQKVSETRC
ncbi:hypothetical protein CHUAL_008852 [Chamberlinius hualienensis]